MDINSSSEGYINFDIKNPNPAETVIQEEFKKINELRPDSHKRAGVEDCAGLAFSGGGIRSSTFNLGVLQALSRNGWLENVDYLSTVSGGGYIGSSLSWLLHRPWEVKAGQKIQWGCNESQFPYGTERQAITRDENDEEVVDSETGRNDGFLYKNNILRYLRQHGNYLTPGKGITFTSFMAAYLRGVILNLFVLIPLLAAIYFAGIKIQHAIPKNIIGFFPESLANWNFAIWIGVFLLALFVFLSLSYSLAAYRRSRSLTKQDSSKDKKPKGYELRRKYEKNIRFVLGGAALFAFMGAIPVLHEALSGFDFFGPKAAGLITSIGGLLSVARGFKSSGEKNGGNMGLWVLGGSFLLILGFLMGAYHYAKHIDTSIDKFNQWYGFYILVAWVFAGIFYAYKTNLNMLSVHRFYRDRLMETFMPNLDRIFREKWDQTNPGDLADSAKLSGMCEKSRPYHIINTNVVMVDSSIPKYHGRGGDSFILSPLYCGSNATGWRTTHTYLNNQLTLPTAMAISGAAVNPNTGVGGEGITRNRLTSLAMRLLNLGLGYWAPHPREGGYRLDLIPDFTFQIGGKLDEQQKLVHLTDGGHFENLGLYELLRRRLKVIICCDGGADDQFTFEDFGNLVEKVRVDFGISIDIDLTPMVPQKQKNGQPDAAERAFVIGTIFYPPDHSRPKEEGILIFIKTTYIKDLPEDVASYKRRNEMFPDQSTADQFFDEKQFEAYRALGFKATQDMIDRWETRKLWPTEKQIQFDFFTGLVKKAFPTA